MVIKVYNMVYQQQSFSFGLPEYNMFMFCAA